MALEKNFFRQVMSQFATGVAVVTASNEGTLAGLTVNAFCSVSLEPLLVLICVDLSSSALFHIRASGAFAINVLTSQQEQLSRCFASHSRERYEEFCHVSYHIVATGAPILDNVLAFIDVKVAAEYPGGDHAIFLGQVEAMGAKGLVAFTGKANRLSRTLSGHDQTVLGDHTGPLIYFCGDYRHLAGSHREPSLAVVSTNRDGDYERPAR